MGTFLQLMRSVQQSPISNEPIPVFLGGSENILTETIFILVGTNALNSDR